jgi:UDP-N-acetylmuramyl pentapeptide phosphotransferase/UDP-N-acetylglucosamine-1-phosphate transferase
MLAIVVGALVACFVVFLIIDRVYTRTGAVVAMIVVILLIAGVVGFLDRRARAGFDDD